MKNTIHRLVLTVAAICFGLSIYAYDFCHIDDTGRSIFYNIVGPDCVEVTYEYALSPSSAYSGDVVIPQQITHNGLIYNVIGIGERAFRFSRKMESISLSPHIEYIGDFAFAGCIALEKIKLPSSVASLGKNIFDGCFALKDITIENSANYTSVINTLYDSSRRTFIIAPQSIDSEIILLPNTEHIAPCAFYGCTFLPGIILPQNLKSIGDNAFYFCGSIKNISIPASVQDIGRTAFGLCSSLENIDVDTENTEYSSFGGVLYNKDMSNIIQAPCCYFPDSPLPSSVREISEMAFMYNSEVTDIALPDGLATVGTGAFISCSEARTLDIPSSVSQIGSMAFALCDTLSAVYLHNPDPSAIAVSSDAFENTKHLIRKLYVPSNSVSAYSMAPVWSDFDEIIGYDALNTQEILWDTDLDIMNSDSTVITLSALATSGLPVEYAIASECRDRAIIEDNHVKVTKGGEITVIAMQHGNNEYTPAPPVRRVINTPLSSISDILDDTDIEVLTRAGHIIINNANPDIDSEIFDASGMMIYSGKSRDIPVTPHNVYIVRIDGKSHKVIVK